MARNISLNSQLETLSNLPNFKSIVKNKLIGIEKESNRVLTDGSLAMSSHPKSLGSKLTNKYITTDYAECQLELITKPHNSINKVLSELENIHYFVYQNINSKELLWPYSIPGNLPKQKNIPIAKFGTSLEGKFREAYRTGLAYRYGKPMQLICGNHFNFSFSEEFWQAYFNKLKNISNSDQKLKNKYYMKLIRNYMRYSWLSIYLFGASPAASSKLFDSNTATANYLKILNNTTYLSPYATSIRESNLGYHNKSNLSLFIDYNDINNYADSLYQAIKTPEPEFEKIGKFRYNKQIQLSCNKLQIENEYYGIIRPKADINIRNTSLYKALSQHGISYIELRNLDLDPSSPIGINHNQCLFLECLMYYCCLQNSPEFSNIDYANIKYNNERTALLGRQPNLQLKDNDNKLVSLKRWAKDIFQDLLIIAQYLDRTNNNNEFQQSIHYYDKLIDNSNLTPSGVIYNNIKHQNLDYVDYFLDLANKNRDEFKNNSLPKDKMDYFNQVISDSINKHIKLEAEDNKIKSSKSIDSIMMEYYK